MIVYSKWLVPTGFDGITAGPFIFMTKPDPGLLKHEQVHYREQAWITPLWWLRYGLSTDFRVAAETRAYKAQVAAGGLTLEQAVGWLMKYDQRLTPETARAGLLEE